MKPTIKSVRTRSELRRFASFPNKLYKGSKFFVPVMVSMEMATFNPKTNHAHEFCDSALWLALDARGNMVGRIAAIINRAYNEAKGMKQGRIGWLDFIDDPDVSAALLETAENWCRERGMTQIAAPWDSWNSTLQASLSKDMTKSPRLMASTIIPITQGTCSQTDT